MAAINSKSIDALQRIFSETLKEINSRTTFRQRMESIDRAMQAEGDISEETIKGKIARLQGKKGKIANVEIPLTKIYTETAHAHYVSTFLTGSPIFAAVASKKNSDSANMLTGLALRDQQRFGWVKHLSQCLEDVLKYNVCAAEVIWEDKRAIGVQTSLEAGTATTGTPNPVIYSGNNIKHLDMYNVFWDPSVNPGEVHEKGTYAGYIEQMNYIQLKQKYLDWDDTWTIKKNVTEIFKGKMFGGWQGQNYYSHLYHEPDITGIRGSSTTQNPWQAFWGTSVKNTPIQGRYEIVTIYQRLIPKEFEVEVPKSGNPQVFKLIYVNGYLAYAEPITSGHEYLPIVIGQLAPGHIDKKSFSEYLEPMQDYATSMTTGTLNAMRRTLLDRALYDPVRIQKSHIEGNNMDSKIPVNGNSYEQPVSNAYMPIPFQDNISGNFQQLLTSVFGLTDTLTGINRSSQGNFIKGNKTRFEFDTIMSNAESRLQLGSICLETSFFRAIKEIIKINFFIYATNETLDNADERDLVQVDPAILREVVPDFMMADGIIPATKLANTDILVQAAQLFGMHPELSMEYDVAGMFVSVMQQQGLHNLKDYKRTQEQMQQYMRMQQAQQAAANPNSQPTGEQTNEGPTPTE